MEKIVIFGWNTITASLADGIKQKFPECEIFCPDAPMEIQKEAQKIKLLSPLPQRSALIYEDADYILINHRFENTIGILKEIKSFLSPYTTIIDFQEIKTKSFENISTLLEDTCTYVSTYVFLDPLPQELIIRSNIFYNKIIAVISNGASETLLKMQTFWHIFHGKIVPTSAEFFDEIICTTIQGPELLASIYARILQKDSWSDTLFFGFYNNHLKQILNAAPENSSKMQKNIFENEDNIKRILSFVKREIEHIEQLLEENRTEALESYLTNTKNFKKRV